MAKTTTSGLNGCEKADTCVQRKSQEWVRGHCRIQIANLSTTTE
jgi:hypothetical protein